MGNHCSQNFTPHNGISYSSIGMHLEKPHTSLPVDRLAKFLVKKTAEEDSVQGIITRKIFMRYVFRKYPKLGHRIFDLLVTNSGMAPSVHFITQNNFCIQVDKILSTESYESQALMYISLYSKNRDEIHCDEFKIILLELNKISLDHCVDGPQNCKHIFGVVQTVIDSALNKKLVVSIKHLAHWIGRHCPRLITILHLYVIHTLSTAYQGIGENNIAKEQNLREHVLEKNSLPLNNNELLLPLSEIWILSTTLPKIYICPVNPSPSALQNEFTSSFVSNILDLTCPTHWTLLYDSYKHGLSSNRFLHHSLSYRGPTLLFLRGEKDVEFCIGVDEEWHESQKYWGGEDCIIVQILPLYHVIERGPKMIYLNFSIRGYPHGIRAGSDPKKPCVSLNEWFNQLIYNGTPYELYRVEVWGCGTQKSREIQLDIRKWEVNQYEKQKAVKMKSSDWLDHLDRRLLELAGRTSYSDSKP